MMVLMEGDECMCKLFSVMDRQLSFGVERDAQKCRRIVHIMIK